jgi:hypothetical protein
MIELAKLMAELVDAGAVRSFRFRERSKVVVLNRELPLFAGDDLNAAHQHCRAFANLNMIMIVTREASCHVAS